VDPEGSPFVSPKYSTQLKMGTTATSRAAFAHQMLGDEENFWGFFFFGGKKEKRRWGGKKGEKNFFSFFLGEKSSRVQYSRSGRIEAVSKIRFTYPLHDHVELHVRATGKKSARAYSAVGAC